MVVDASAWVGVATGRLEPDDLGSTPLLVPAHFDAEVLSALRGLVRGGHFEPDEGEAWWQATLAAPLERVPLADLPDLWGLTTAVGAYDAPYVAVAVQARVPLLTTDARLARGAEPHCDVVLRGR